MQLNVRAEGERGIKINPKQSGDNMASSPGFHCTSRMMAAEAGFGQRDHIIARRASPQNHPKHIQTHAPVATITHIRMVPSPTGLLASARPSAHVTPPPQRPPLRPQGPTPSALLVTSMGSLCLSASRIFYCIIFLFQLFKKQNLNASRPSEHPPVRGGEGCQNV